MSTCNKISFTNLKTFKFSTANQKLWTCYGLCTRVQNAHVGGAGGRKFWNF